MSTTPKTQTALDVPAGSTVPVWAVFWKGELYCCRATEREALAVGFQFRDQGAIRIISGTFTPNTRDDRRRATDSAQPNSA